MSVGIFFVVFFFLLLGVVVWILRHPKSRPLTSGEKEHWRRKKKYWVWDPSVPGNPGHDE
jgi:hypothetical protein